MMNDRLARLKELLDRAESVVAIRSKEYSGEMSADDRAAADRMKAEAITERDHAKEALRAEIERTQSRLDELKPIV